MRGDENAVHARFAGAILGALAGDALGMPLEGLTPEAVGERYGVVTGFLPGRLPAGNTTDDSEMTLALTESLVTCRGFSEEHFAARLLARYDPERGYGQGTSAVLERLAVGVPWDQAGRGLHGGEGSLGNGAAVRVTAAGLLFHENLALVADVARRSADVTHRHPLGRAGAAVQALAVAVALRWGVGGPETLSTRGFVAALYAHLEPEEAVFGRCLEQVLGLVDRCPALPLDARPAERLAQAREVTTVLGSDARSYRSVPAALWSFLVCRPSVEAAIVTAANLGGDADTIAAMAGAVAGAYAGRDAVPARWLDGLESGPGGVGHAQGLAEDLYLLWLEEFCAGCERP